MTTEGYFDPTLKKQELFKLQPRRPPSWQQQHQQQQQRGSHDEGIDSRPPTAPLRVQRALDGDTRVDAGTEPIGAAALRTLQHMQSSPPRSGSGSGSGSSGSPVSRVNGGMTIRTNGVKLYFMYIIR